MIIAGTNRHPKSLSKTRITTEKGYPEVFIEGQLISDVVSFQLDASVDDIMRLKVESNVSVGACVEVDAHVELTICPHTDGPYEVEFDTSDPKKTVVTVRPKFNTEAEHE